MRLRGSVRPQDHGNPRGKARADGDEARDSRNWPLAEKYYTAHLEMQPNDSAIWVQLGHALKEQAKLPQAELAYRRAVTLSPDDADAHLQLAHALKLQSKRAESEAAYERSYELAPSRTVYEEIVSVKGKARAGSLLSEVRKQASEKMVYFEVMDLMNWMRAHKTLSGIQRVQAGIIMNVLEKTDKFDPHFGFVVGDEIENSVRRIWPSDMAALMEYATSSEIDHAELRRLVEIATSKAIEVEISKGQCYFILGAFWGFSDQGRYIRMKNAGASIGVYIYDLIPYTHPEFCDDLLVSGFRRALADGLAWFDFVLTISEFTAQELRRLQADLKLRPTPVKAIPLAHLLKEDALGKDSDTWTNNIAELRGKRFAMSVSTVEIRKNHAYLVSAWKLMLDEGLDPPDLVFVGRYGWRVNDLMEQMRATNFLNGRIHVLHDLTDAELETLYRASEFTLFPSFIEGWGLPVGESLAHGKPCLASNTSSIPEVGGDLVDYLDPHNVRSGVEVIRRMAFDENYRKRRTAEIQTKFVARSWAEVTAKLLKSIEDLRHSDANYVREPMLRTSELFIPRDVAGGTSVPPEYFLRPLRLILSENWFTPENFGAWMSGKVGTLRFQSNLPPKTEAVVYLRLVGSPLSRHQQIEVFGRNPDSDKRIVFTPLSKRIPAFPVSVSQNVSLKNLGERDFVVRVNVTTSSTSLVEVGLQVHGQALPQPNNDTRQIYVGLVGLGHATRSDTSLRMDITEMLASI